MRYERKQVVIQFLNAPGSDNVQEYERTLSPTLQVYINTRLTQ